MWLPSTLQIVLIPVLCILVLLTAIGNALLCFFLLYPGRDRNKRDSYIASICVADFFTCVTVIPLSVTYGLDLTGQSGQVYCGVWTFLDVTLCAVTIYTLAVICMELSFHVKNNYTSLHKVAHTKTSLLIGGIWTMGILLGGVSYVVVMFSWRKEANERLSLENCLFIENIYIVGMFATLVFALPSLWCLIVFIKLTVHLCLSNKGPQISDIQPDITISGIRLLIFFISWCPFFTVTVISSLCNKKCIGSLTQSLVLWLPYVSSWVNPFLYGMLKRHMHQGLQQVCSCCSLTRSKNQTVLPPAGSSLSHSSDISPKSMPGQESAVFHAFSSVTLPPSEPFLSAAEECCSMKQSLGNRDQDPVLTESWHDGAERSLPLPFFPYPPHVLLDPDTISKMAHVTLQLPNVADVSTVFALLEKHNAQSENSKQQDVSPCSNLRQEEKQRLRKWTKSNTSEASQINISLSESPRVKEQAKQLTQADLLYDRKFVDDFAENLYEKKFVDNFTENLYIGEFVEDFAENLYDRKFVDDFADDLGLVKVSQDQLLKSRTECSFEKNPCLLKHKSISFPSLESLEAESVLCSASRDVSAVELSQSCIENSPQQLGKSHFDMVHYSRSWPCTFAKGEKMQCPNEPGEHYVQVMNLYSYELSMEKSLDDCPTSVALTNRVLEIHTEDHSAASKVLEIHAEDYSTVNIPTQPDIESAMNLEERDRYKPVQQMKTCSGQSPQDSAKTSIEDLNETGKVHTSSLTMGSLTQKAESHDEERKINSMSKMAHPSQNAKPASKLRGCSTETEDKEPTALLLEKPANKWRDALEKANAIYINSKQMNHFTQELENCGNDHTRKVSVSSQNMKDEYPSYVQSSLATESKSINCEAYARSSTQSCVENVNKEQDVGGNSRNTLYLARGKLQPESHASIQNAYCKQKSGARIGGDSMTKGKVNLVEQKKRYPLKKLPYLSRSASKHLEIAERRYSASKQIKDSDKKFQFSQRRKSSSSIQPTSTYKQTSSDWQELNNPNKQLRKQFDDEQRKPATTGSAEFFMATSDFSVSDICCTTLEKSTTSIEEEELGFKNTKELDDFSEGTGSHLSDKRQTDSVLNLLEKGDTNRSTSSQVSFRQVEVTIPSCEDELDLQETDQSDDTPNTNSFLGPNCQTLNNVTSPVYETNQTSGQTPGEVLDTSYMENLDMCATSPETNSSEPDENIKTLPISKIEPSQQRETQQTISDQKKLALLRKILDQTKRENPQIFDKLLNDDVAGNAYTKECAYDNTAEERWTLGSENQQNLSQNISGENEVAELAKPAAKKLSESQRNDKTTKNTLQKKPLPRKNYLKQKIAEKKPAKKTDANQQQRVPPTTRMPRKDQVSEVKGAVSLQKSPKPLASKEKTGKQSTPIPRCRQKKVGPYVRDNTSQVQGKTKFGILKDNFQRKQDSNLSKKPQQVGFHSRKAKCQKAAQDIDKGLIKETDHLPTSSNISTKTGIQFQSMSHQQSSETESTNTSTSVTKLVRLFEEKSSESEAQITEMKEKPYRISKPVKKCKSDNMAPIKKTKVLVSSSYESVANWSPPEPNIEQFYADRSKKTKLRSKQIQHISELMLEQSSPYVIDPIDKTLLPTELQWSLPASQKHSTELSVTSGLAKGITVIPSDKSKSQIETPVTRDSDTTLSFTEESDATTFQTKIDKNSLPNSDYTPVLNKTKCGDQIKFKPTLTKNGSDANKSKPVLSKLYAYKKAQTPTVLPPQTDFQQERSISPEPTRTSSWKEPLGKVSPGARNIDRRTQLSNGKNGRNCDTLEGRKPVRSTSGCFGDSKNVGSLRTGVYKAAKIPTSPSPPGHPVDFRPSPNPPSPQRYSPLRSRASPIASTKMGSQIPRPLHTSPTSPFYRNPQGLRRTVAKVPKATSDPKVCRSDAEMGNPVHKEESYDNETTAACPTSSFSSQRGRHEQCLKEKECFGRYRSCSPAARTRETTSKEMQSKAENWPSPDSDFSLSPDKRAIGRGPERGQDVSDTYRRIPCRLGSPGAQSGGKGDRTSQPESIFGIRTNAGRGNPSGSKSPNTDSTSDQESSQPPVSGSCDSLTSASPADSPASASPPCSADSASPPFSTVSGSPVYPPVSGSPYTLVSGNPYIPVLGSPFALFSGSPAYSPVSGSYYTPLSGSPLCTQVSGWPPTPPSCYTGRTYSVSSSTERTPSPPEHGSAPFPKPRKSIKPPDSGRGPDSGQQCGKPVTDLTSGNRLIGKPVSPNLRVNSSIPVKAKKAGQESSPGVSFKKDSYRQVPETASGSDSASTVRSQSSRKSRDRSKFGNKLPVILNTSAKTSEASESQSNRETSDNSLYEFVLSERRAELGLDTTDQVRVKPPRKYDPASDCDSEYSTKLSNPSFSTLHGSTSLMQMSSSNDEDSNNDDSFWGIRTLDPRKVPSGKKDAAQKHSTKINLTSQHSGWDTHPLYSESALSTTFESHPQGILASILTQQRQQYLLQSRSEDSLKKSSSSGSGAPGFPFSSHAQNTRKRRLVAQEVQEKEDRKRGPRSRRW